MYDNATDEPHRLVATSVGLAIPADRNQYGYLSEHKSFGQTDQKAGDYAEDLAATMLATILGVEFDPNVSYDERKDVWRMSDKIVTTRNITQSAIGDRDGLWTSVVAAAVFVDTAQRYLIAERQSQRHDLVGRRDFLRWGRFHIVRHHQQVVLLAMPILDVVVERGLGAKTETLENPNRAWLIGDHFRQELLEPGPLGQLEDRLGKQVAEPPPAIRGMRDDANLTDMTRPSMALAFEDGRADDSFACHRDHRGLAIEVDLVEPGLDFLAI